MSLVEKASGAIRQAGGRLTSQRQLIVELLEKAERHLDADELYQLAHEQDPSISLTTVYRTVNFLAESKLIDEVYLSREHTRKYYEPVTDSEHYHFICRECHQVIEFESQFVDEIRHDLETRLGVRVDNICICVEGVCPSCQSREK